jgi:hypothetical protein
MWKSQKANQKQLISLVFFHSATQTLPLRQYPPLEGYTMAIVPPARAKTVPCNQLVLLHPTFPLKAVQLKDTKP